MADEGNAEAYFRDRGYEVVFSERDLHAEHMASGKPGRASFYRAGVTYFCVTLTRDGAVIAPDYSCGESREAALVAARKRYRSEQE